MIIASEKQTFEFSIADVESPELITQKKEQEIKSFMEDLRKKLMALPTLNDYVQYNIGQFKMPLSTFHQKWREYYEAHYIKLKSIRNGANDIIGFRIFNLT